MDTTTELSVETTSTQDFIHFDKHFESDDESLDVITSNDNANTNDSVCSYHFQVHLEGTDEVSQRSHTANINDHPEHNGENRPNSVDFTNEENKDYNNEKPLYHFEKSLYHNDKPLACLSKLVTAEGNRFLDFRFREDNFGKFSHNDAGRCTFSYSHDHHLLGNQQSGYLNRLDPYYVDTTSNMRTVSINLPNFINFPPVVRLPASKSPTPPGPHATVSLQMEPFSRQKCLFSLHANCESSDMANTSRHDTIGRSDFLLDKKPIPRPSFLISDILGPRISEMGRPIGPESRDRPFGICRDDMVSDFSSSSKFLNTCFVSPINRNELSSARKNIHQKLHERRNNDRDHKEEDTQVNSEEGVDCEVHSREGSRERTYTNSDSDGEGKNYLYV